MHQPYQDVEKLRAVEVDRLLRTRIPEIPNSVYEMFRTISKCTKTDIAELAKKSTNASATRPSPGATLMVVVNIPTLYRTRFTDATAATLQCN